MSKEKKKLKPFDWECKEHGTFGDKGWSCAICGYPLGTPVLKTEKGRVKRLWLLIDLRIFRIEIWKIMAILPTKKRNNYDH